MISETDFKTIKKTAEEFFQKTSFEVEIEEFQEKDGVLFVKIKTEEPQILIGEGGKTLAEIQYLLKAILRRKISSRESFYVDIDINDYKKKKTEYLKDLARSTADEVALTKKEETLPLMSAYERRIIHLELAGRQDVATESMGEGIERRLMIKPKL